MFYLMKSFQTQIADSLYRSIFLSFHLRSRPPLNFSLHAKFHSASQSLYSALRLNKIKLKI